MNGKIVKRAKQVIARGDEAGALSVLTELVEDIANDAHQVQAQRHVDESVSRARAAGRKVVCGSVIVTKGRHAGS